MLMTSPAAGVIHKVVGLRTGGARGLLYTPGFPYTSYSFTFLSVHCVRSARLHESPTEGG